MQPARKAVYIAATRQHVGKSSVCLGLMSSLRQKFDNNVGFIKPVGQRHTIDEETGELIDTDVNTVVDYFNMIPKPNLKAMSPIILDRNHTRDVWADNGLNNMEVLNTKKKTIIDAFNSVRDEHTFTVVEGTGKCNLILYSICYMCRYSIDNSFFFLFLLVIHLSNILLFNISYSSF